MGSILRYFHSLIQQVFTGGLHLPGSVLGAADTAVNGTGKSLCSTLESRHMLCLAAGSTMGEKKMRRQGMVGGCREGLPEQTATGVRGPPGQEGSTGVVMFVGGGQQPQGHRGGRGGVGEGEGEGQQARVQQPSGHSKNSGTAST